MKEANKGSYLKFLTALYLLPDTDAHKKKCTVFPFHPWGPKEERKEGVVLWVPRTVAQLIYLAEEQLHCSCSAIMSEEGGKITDVGLISDGQKLYMIIDNTG